MRFVGRLIIELPVDRFCDLAGCVCVALLTFLTLMAATTADMEERLWLMRKLFWLSSRRFTLALRIASFASAFVTVPSCVSIVDGMLLVS